MSTCVDPFEYFINYAEWYISNNPGTTFLDVLNQSNVFPLSSDICCPTCGENGFKSYVLSGNFNDGNPSSFFNHFDTFNRLNDYCCFNTHVTVDIYESIVNSPNTSLSDLPSPCCTSSDFKTCLSELANFLNSDQFNKYINNFLSGSSGVVEWNTIDNNTLMCSIYNVLSKRDPEVALGYILDILNNGLVINCRFDGIAITSIQNFNLMYPPIA